MNLVVWCFVLAAVVGLAAASEDETGAETRSKRRLGISYRDEYVCFRDRDDKGPGHHKRMAMTLLDEKNDCDAKESDDPMVEARRVPYDVRFESEDMKELLESISPWFDASEICIEMGSNRSLTSRELAMKEKRRILEDEQEISIGSRIRLSDKERKANRLLMELKVQEIEDAEEDKGEFYPGENFLTVRDGIRQSEVFKFIRRMPKGALLRGTASTQIDIKTIVNLILKSDHLYVKISGKKLRLSYFAVPPKEDSVTRFGDSVNREYYSRRNTDFRTKSSEPLSFPDYEAFPSLSYDQSDPIRVPLVDKLDILEIFEKGKDKIKDIASKGDDKKAGEDNRGPNKNEPTKGGSEKGDENKHGPNKAGEEKREPEKPDEDNRGPNKNNGDNRGPNKNDGDNRGPEKPDEDNRGPNENNGDNRGPNKNDGDNRGPNKNDGDNRGPNKNDGDNRGPEKPDEDKRGPNKNDGDNRGPNKNDGDNRGPNKNDGDNRGPNKNDGDNRGPNKNDGDNRGPNKNDGDNRGPNKNDGDNRGPEKPDEDKRGPNKNDGDNRGPNKDDRDKPNQDRRSPDYSKWVKISDVKRRYGDEELLKIVKRIVNAITIQLDDDDLAPTGRKVRELMRTGREILDVILNFRPNFLEAFEESLKQLREDGIQYAEVRTDFPEVYELNGFKYGPSVVMTMYRDKIKEHRKKYPDSLGVKFIYAPRRSDNLEEIKRQFITFYEVYKQYPKLLVGMDLAGTETNSKALNYYFAAFFNLPPSVRFYFQAGLTNWWGTVSDRNILDAYVAKASRIGHAHALVKHPVALKKLRAKSTPVEFCPIFTQVTGYVRDLRNSPLAYLFATDHPIVIGNEEPLFWGGNGLSYDFYAAFMALTPKDGDLRALKQLALNSWLYSSLPTNSKKIAIEAWEKQWRQFLREIDERVQVRSLAENY